ncbi:bifunctional aspartate kinase/homoserine dehydrogenase I [Flammeovirgaceae bacterium SG7u.111]|nr:bifunctional aspartate kinase/homoserine dehydrogenase I [Flammeovirgaceae bacterium SG7u.132]WPO35323.1 bifunctional aspartate kinase/homoserine dehydrogenase I [Flammeovirgaceae bacterium SG7u.111]
MKVLKFGGTSVGSPEIIKQVIKIVKPATLKEKVVVVVSAFGGVTDQLIAISRQAAEGDATYKELYKAIEHRHIDAIKELVHARKQSGLLADIKYLFNELDDILHGVYLVRELSPKMQDFILSFGERLSARIISEAFKEQDVNTEFADARNFIRTNRIFGNADVDFEVTNKQIVEYFKNTDITLQIVPGFVASTDQGETSTLGRGGSDYTASILAAALNADLLEIWTDVNGMMTSDPKKVKKAFTIPEISYEEAMEISYFGAKVIYPPSIQPAYNKRIPIAVKNTYDPEGADTLINTNAPDGKRPIRGISSMKDVSLITLFGSGMIGVTGTAKRLFNCLADAKINVIMISQASSEHSITIAVKELEAYAAAKLIREEFEEEIAASRIEDVKVENGLSVVAVVGKNMKNTPGISGKLFSSLGKNGINVLTIAQGASELNISFVINRSDESKALNVIHEAFFLSDTKVLNIFVAGATGLIGTTLVKQIKAHSEWLKSNNAIDVKLAGLINTKKMLISEEGIDLDNYKEILGSSDSDADLPKFVEEMKKANLPNSVFVDATASADVSEQYAKVLNSSISIVTPNKLACSGSMEYYKELKELSHKRGAKFLFETNVGAGLPVIGTLNDLVHSGDKILKIEAILSGTLNFIFNTVSSERKMSDVVVEARENGFTEPDPRIDLSGSDVARKILILSRELGYDMNIDEVEMKPFIPEKYFEADSVEQFLKNLEEFDGIFEADRSKLDAKEQKYRVIAKLENGKASISLNTYDKGDSFYAAAGSDNIILYTTERYLEQPLMIKGPGAGAEVTAAGVFADIIRVVA